MIKKYEILPFLFMLDLMMIFGLCAFAFPSKYISPYALLHNLHDIIWVLLAFCILSYLLLFWLAYRSKIFSSTGRWNLQQSRSANIILFFVFLLSRRLFLALLGLGGIGGIL